jgi:asparagine synthase (glutamine-hydrolysing)
MSLLAGYSAVSAEDLVAGARAGTFPGNYSGDYTAVVSDPEDGSIWLASSPIAAFPCYMARDASGRPHFGTDVFSVARAARLSWSWNRTAILQMALFGHTIGRETLHPQVHRLPNDALLRVDAKSVDQATAGFWQRFSRVGESRRYADDPGAVLELLRASVRRIAGDQDVLLSLSAGYDSRLLLALCLAEGIRPRCVTMGSPDCTDFETGAYLARESAVEHHRIELRPSDYLRYGPVISKITSGVKTVGNWHTYLYAREAAGASGEVHLVGSNGEFARSFYLPGRHAPGVAARLPAFLMRGYWWLRLERRRLRFRDWPLISGGGIGASLALSSSTIGGGNDLATALDRFYAEQRVRHFIGSGLALYAAVGKPRSPFLDAEVLAAIYRLTRSMRTENALHRACVEALRPGFNTIPYNWPLSGQGAVVGYSPFAAVRLLPESAERIIECSFLDELVSRQEREQLVRTGGLPSFELLLTLAFAADCAAEVDAP